MKKKGLLALLILVTVIVAAPDAMADHCWRCHLATQTCIPSPFKGREECDDSTGVCVLSGALCHQSTPSQEPLAADFAVASVERLDEPHQPATELRVATLEAPKKNAER